MSHLPPNVAIFSPSVARAAASTAKDWAYVDAWLVAKFRPRPPPPFERNPDTLRALLALATLNEAADDQRRLLDRVERSAAQDEDARDGGDDDGDNQDQKPPTVRRSVLAAVHASLSRDGAAALDAMAAASVELGLARPTPAAVSARLVDLAARGGEVEADAARSAVLARHVDARTADADALLADVQGPAYAAPADLARLNLETQRRIRVLEASLPDLRDRVAVLAAGAGTGSGAATPDPSIEQVRADEEAYLALLQRKKDLDVRIKAFHGLPPDTAQARREFEARRAELLRLTQRRDAVFEGLVERETPRKPR